tara:strand:- start:98 stop:391 length:294 start_codon:yes stop_codon:yes gene_type:complete
MRRDVMKYENFANKLDVIRAYDFEFSKDAYLEGMIVDKGWIKDPETGMNLFLGYTVHVMEDGGGMGRVGDTAYVAFETSMDYDGRIEMVSPAPIEEI